MVDQTESCDNNKYSYGLLQCMLNSGQLDTFKMFN